MPGFISEVDYDGGAPSNFVEVVVPMACDTSGYTLVIYNNDGTVIETFSLGTPVNTVAGKNVFLIDGSDPNWVDLHDNEAVALVDDRGTVLQFIAFKDPVTAVEGPANGMAATQIGAHSGGDTPLASTDGGSRRAPTPISDPGMITCYAPGTLIATQAGPRWVEALVPGDGVLTADRGSQPVEWVTRFQQSLNGLPEGELPVLIRRGALGAGVPERDLVVSSQHRVLVGGFGQLTQIFRTAVFVPATALTGLPGIRVVRGRKSMTWHHFACARHEVVTAEGCRSESLLMGPAVRRILSSRPVRRVDKVIRLAGGADPASSFPARPCLTVTEARERIATGRLSAAA